MKGISGLLAAAVLLALLGAALLKLSFLERDMAQAQANVTMQTYDGVEETFAPELVRTDQVAIDETSAAVHVGETVIHFADDAYIAAGEARKLAEALVELADYADGVR